QSIEKVRQQVYVDTLLLEKSSQKAFFFKKKNVLYKILPTDIIWVESNDNYINVITKEHTFIVNNTLKSFEQILSKSNFLRTHRRYIINLEHLVCIEDNHLCVEINGKTASIPLSRNYKETLLNTAISLK
ncbi:MAG TPA: LytTR family DNA-binding domain-containing protein, partial [Bacteroidales bacterium]|nr:LytTR family DNA-binding domain-containing protein [Bacteroidales bacterium]